MYLTFPSKNYAEVTLSPQSAVLTTLCGEETMFLSYLNLNLMDVIKYPSVHKGHRSHLL